MHPVFQLPLQSVVLVAWSEQSMQVPEVAGPIIPKKEQNISRGHGVSWSHVIWPLVPMLVISLYAVSDCSASIWAVMLFR